MAVWLEIRYRNGQTRFVQVDRSVVLGRDPATDVPIADEAVSRRHASLTPGPSGEWVVQDENSSNGTMLDGRPVTSPTVVPVGSTIVLGDTAVRIVGAPPPTPPPVVAASASPSRVSRVSRSAIERMKLTRATRLATVLGALAILTSGTLAVVLVANALKPPPRTSEDVVATVTRSTVLVLTSGAKAPLGSGTGWVVDDEGHVVTNAHVVNGGVSFQVGFAGSKSPASLVAVAPCEDLAVLSAPGLGQDAVPLPLGSQSTIRQAQRVIALGFPASASEKATLVVTEGIVSVVSMRFDLRSVDVPQYPNVIQTTAAINPGNSGGPLVDMDARLVGVNSAGITLLGDRIIQGQGYAIGVDRVRELLPALQQGRSSKWTGFDFALYVTRESLEADPGLGKRLVAAGLPARPGIVVAGAAPASPAARTATGGFPALITAIDGVEMDGTLPGYCDAVRDGAGTVDVRIVPAGLPERVIRLALG